MVSVARLYEGHAISVIFENQAVLSNLGDRQKRNRLKTGVWLLHWGDMTYQVAVCYALITGKTEPQQWDSVQTALVFILLEQYTLYFFSVFNFVCTQKSIYTFNAQKKSKQPVQVALLHK